MTEKATPGQGLLVFDELPAIEAAPVDLLAESVAAPIEESPVVMETEPEPEPAATRGKGRKKKEKLPEPITDDSAIRGIAKLFEGFRYRHNIYQTFTDFCAMAALSISNTVDGGQYGAREKEYHEIAKRYSKEEIDIFPQILAKLTEALAELGPRDILGTVYMQLEISNKGAGQFFTPREVSECMAMISLTGVGEVIDRQGHFTMQEPACGGGGMVFAACKVVNQQGYNYQEHMHVTAIDIDMKCAQMCYIQMSLLGVPGVVYHGDTLSMKMNSSWWTPAHVTGDWHTRLGWNREAEEEAKEAA